MTDHDTAAIVRELLNDEAFAKALANRLDIEAIGQSVTTDKAFAKEMAHQLDTGAFGERVATDPTFAAAFTANLTHELDTRALEREDRRYNRARFAMSAIGLLGLVGLGGAVTVFMDGAAQRAITDERANIVLAVKDELKTGYETSLAQAVAGLRTEIVANGKRGEENRAEILDKFEEAQNEMRLAVDLVVIEGLATKLDEGLGFLAEERDSIMAALRKIPGDSRLRDEPQLASVIGKASRAFYAANQQLALEEIDELYSDVVARDQAIADTFITYYGERLLATIGAPVAWTPFHLDRLDFYGKAVRSLDYPELVLPYEILIAYIKAGKQRTNESVEMLRRLRDLRSEEEAITYYSLLKYSDPSFWQTVETEFARSIAAIARSFDEQYRDVMDERWRDDEVAESLFKLAFQNKEDFPRLFDAVDERLNEVIE